MKKTTKVIKKEVKSGNKQKKVDKKDELKQLLKKVSDDATAKINDLKKKFDAVDADTKNKIITGLSVVAAGLVVLAGVKKINKGKKK